MRPEALFPLFAEATSLPGIGPRVLKLVERAARGNRVIDVINTLPISVVDNHCHLDFADGDAQLSVQIDYPEPSKRVVSQSS